MTTGFLVVDKPSGITSHDVVDRVRKATGVRKVGHTGTLDPMATGAVVVAIGGVTRLIRFLQDLDKEYVATACFGVATDSLDADGEVIEERPMVVSREDLESVRPRFMGEIQQMPPMVSALKKDGKRLYELAREGVEVERDERTVVIHELEILDVTDDDHPLVTFRVVCGKGTYVRSLADDIARALGGFAHLTALRRVRTGSLSVSEGIQVSDLSDWQSRLISPLEALSFLPAMVVADDVASLVANGRPIPAGDQSDGLIEVVSADARLLAVYRCRDGVARPEVVLA